MASDKGTLSTRSINGRHEQITIPCKAFLYHSLRGVVRPGREETGEEEGESHA